MNEEVEVKRRVKTIPFEFRRKKAQMVYPVILSTRGLCSLLVRYLALPRFTKTQHFGCGKRGPHYRVHSPPIDGHRSGEGWRKSEIES